MSRTQHIAVLGVVFLACLVVATWYVFAGGTRGSSPPQPDVRPSQGPDRDTSDRVQGNPSDTERIDSDRNALKSTPPGGTSDPGSDTDVLERVVMELVFRGQLAVDAAAYPPIHWPDTKFALSPISPFAVWVDLRLTSVVDESGAFEVRATCRRMPESAGHDDEYMVQQIATWSHVTVSASHALLEETTVDVPAEPWPSELIAGEGTVRVFDTGVVRLPLASGVLGRVVGPGGEAADGAVVALYLLNGEGDMESTTEAAFVRADGDGRFFLHHAPGTRGLFVATARGLVPQGREAELAAATVTDLGTLELQSGLQIEGRLEWTGSLEAGDRRGGMLFDGFDTPLRATAETHHEGFFLVATLEGFYWTGSEVFRYRGRANIAADGSFTIGGLSARCHRLRAEATLRGRERYLLDYLVGRRSDVWTVECAPAAGVTLRPSTSSVHIRVVRPISKDPRLSTLAPWLGGDVSWIDDRGDAQSMRVPNFHDITLEAFPQQAFEIRMNGDPTGRVHRLTAPPAGEVKSYEIEIPRMAREGG